MANFAADYTFECDALEVVARCLPTDELETRASKGALACPKPDSAPDS